MRLLTLILILFCTLATEIVCAQYTTRDSCICYTDKQDKRSIECFILQEKKDVIIREYKSLTDSALMKLEISNELNIVKDTIIDLKDVKIKKKNRNLFKLTLVTIGAGVIAILK